MLKIPWNTQKTPTQHVLRLFEKFLKIRFSAQKFGSRPRFRTMLKYHETPRKHQLNGFWGFLRNFWKSGSRLKNPVLGSDVGTMLKIHWDTQKTTTKPVLTLFKNFLKIRFSAQKSDSRLRCRTMLKIHWNTKKTPTKHVLTLYKNFFKIRVSAQNPVLGPDVEQCYKILWNTQKTPTKHAFRHFKKFLKTTYFFWIENIPQDISCDTHDVLVQYIDFVIKTDIPDESDVDLCQLVKRLQTHSHSKYFRKTPPSSGRFKFPFVLQII